MSLRVAVAVLVAMSVLLSGCSSSTVTTSPSAAGTPSTSVTAGQRTTAPATPTATPTPTASQSAANPSSDQGGVLRAAVTAYSDAFLSGRGKEAYQLLSARCRSRTSEASFTAIVNQAKRLYGTALPIRSYDATIRVDLARVTYTYDVPAINQTSEPWVFESGGWHNDDC